MPVNYTNTSVDVLASSFQVLEELGSGSFGVVYKAIEKESGTIVAIKHIDLESSADDIREIQQEISVLSSCASPFVTQYYGSFVRGFKLWIIMEYLAGGSCLDLLKPAPFCEAHIAIVMRELLQGLEYLHREGKIHRDIKAANILLSGTGQVKLADFGVATQLNNIKSQRNTFVGTPFWMAPEVISQENPYSFKADIWSLGITAMELCNGEPPHSTIHPMKVLFLIPKEPAPRLEGNRWSRDFKDFVERCLVKDPNQRASARELLNHRFIKNAGRVEELQSLIERREAWQLKREARGVTKSHPRLYEETMNTFGGQPEESWDFDTIRTNPHSSTIRIDHHRNAMRASEIISERSMNSALQKLNLNAAPQSGVSVTEARKVSEPAAKAHNQKRRRSSIAKKPTEKTVLESTTPTRTNQKPARPERPMTAETDYGKTPSTVRQFKRVPENTPRNYEAVHHQEKELKLESEKPVMSIPTTEEGQLGRKLFSKVVQKTLLEVENKAIKNGNSATAAATSNLAEAWSQLDAIDPESGYELLRAMMERFQQHQPKPQPEAQAQNQPIRQLASSRPFQKSPAAEAAAKMITPKPSLSSETLTAASSSPPPEPTPKVITRTKRASSNVAHKKKRRSSRQSSDFGDEVDDDNYLGSTPAGNQLADVLYGRWVEGLKGRWGAVAK